MSMSLDSRSDGKFGRIEANTDSDWASCAENGEAGNWCEPWEVVHRSGKKLLDAAFLNCNLQYTPTRESFRGLVLFLWTVFRQDRCILVQRGMDFRLIGVTRNWGQSRRGGVMVTYQC